MSRRPNAARCRAAVLWGLASFAAAQAVLALGIEYRWPALRDEEEAVKLAGLADCRARTAGRPLLLALGSSRIFTGIRPDVLPRLEDPSGVEPAVYNYGKLGMGPVRELVTLQSLLARGLRPDYLLLECWAPFLDEASGVADIRKIDLSRYAWADRRSLRRFEVNRRRFDRNWLETHLIPWYACRQVMRDHVSNYGWDPSATRRDDLYTTGWMAIHRFSPQTWEHFAALYREWYGPSVRHWRLSPAADTALREILTLCRREGIRVSLIVLPEEGSFRSLYAPESAAAASAYLRGISAEYGVPLTETREWMADADFYDPIHLSDEGAVPFTGRLGREVLRPLLASGTGRSAVAGAAPAGGSSAGF